MTRFLIAKQVGPEGTTLAEKLDSKNGTIAFARDYGDTAVAADMLTLRDLDDPRCWNDYMRLHGIPEAEREFYPLSSIDLDGVEICEPTEDMAPTLTM